MEKYEHRKKGEKRKIRQAVVYTTYHTQKKSKKKLQRNNPHKPKYIHK